MWEFSGEIRTALWFAIVPAFLAVAVTLALREPDAPPTGAVHAPVTLREGNDIDGQLVREPS